MHINWDCRYQGLGLINAIHGKTSGILYISNISLI